MGFNYLMKPSFFFFVIRVLIMFMYKKIKRIHYLILDQEDKNESQF